MVHDAIAALGRLRSAAQDGTLDEICERHDVRLLSAFGSALARPDPGDLDLAVGFRGDRRDLLDFLDDRTQLTGFDHLDVAVLDAADPVLRARRAERAGPVRVHPGRLRHRADGRPRGGAGHRLAPTARPRDVHPMNPRQPDFAVELVTRAVEDILDLMPRYVDEVATFLRSSPG